MSGEPAGGGMHQIPSEGGPGEDASNRIQLDETPTPAAEVSVPTLMNRPRVELPPLPGLAARPEEETQSRLARTTAFVKKGYFDPFAAFGMKVDWARFARAQTFLFLLSLVAPFLMLLFAGTFLALMVLLGAALASATTPNPIHELAIYPLAFVIAKGYWVAYMLLPVVVFALGWIWSALTAWILSRNSDPRVMDFKKALSILAMLGAMLAPFTTFPLLRLIAIAVLLWYTFKRMKETFDIDSSKLALSGGISFLAITFAYSRFERTVESWYRGSSELNSNLVAFQKEKKKLEWPFKREAPAPDPYMGLFAQLDSFNPELRGQAQAKALDVVKSSTEKPEVRFSLAIRLAEVGNPEAMIFASRFCLAGTGTPRDLPAALGWAQKASQLQPKNLDMGLDEAKLLFLNDRPLDGKRRFVALAKDNIQSLMKITLFIQREGFGKVDSSCQADVQNLYQYQASYSASYSQYAETQYRSYGGPTSRQDALARRVAASDPDGGQWFLRALVAEYGKLGPADPEVYGESTQASREHEFNQKLESGDPYALEVEADRHYKQGDVAKARELWKRETLALRTDNRWANSPVYLKLAESYDPASAKKEASQQEAVKYYLASVLVSGNQSQQNPRVVEALKRLGVSIEPDPLNTAFLDLCIRYDIPEAWAAMGGRYLLGSGAGVARNPGKALECFRKAQGLGYQGPLVYKNLAELDPTNSARWLAMGTPR